MSEGLGTASPVSKADCDWMNDLAAAGHSYHEIAQTVDRCLDTVRRHCIDDCHHLWQTPPNKPTDEELAAALAALARERQAVPSTDDWNRWEGRLCMAGTVITQFGSWQNAHDAAGLPVIALEAPLPIRKAAYQIPWLTRSTEETYQAEQTQGAAQHAEVSD